MFTIPRSSYDAWRRMEAARIDELRTRGYEETRRLGQRFYDYFGLHKLRSREDCVLADQIYNASFPDSRTLINSVIDEAQ